MKDSTKILEEKSNLFVFDRTEVILILVFVVVIAATSFTIGVRVGKKLLLESRGYDDNTVSSVELKSNKEEYAENLNSNEKIMTDEELQNAQLDNMKEELEKLDQDPAVEPVAEAPAKVATEVEPVMEPDVVTKVEEEESTNPYLGKYTVQLGSYQNLEDAKNFAEGFVLKGYDPIVNRVEIPEKGYWYRVSVGAFDNRSEAADYIKTEKSLFLGKEYRIYQVK